MKFTYLLLLSLFIVSCNPYGEETDNQITIDFEYYASITHDGDDRTFFVHLPNSYTPSRAYPILFAMHGGGSLGYEGVAGQSQLSDLSDQEDFIVVYPEGKEQVGFRTWNAGDCCPSATLLGTDDTGFIVALLEHLKTQHSINDKRVYATGFSNGGQLAYKLANEYSNTFAAVGAVAGVLQDFPYNTSRKVPAIHIHSYADTTAPYYGGFSDAPLITFEFPSVDETLLQIANNYNCGTIKETIFTNPTTYDHFRYSDCDNNVIVEQYVTHDGGHTWPGGQAFAGMPLSNHIDASQLLWDFFSNYELP